MLTASVAAARLGSPAARAVVVATSMASWTPVPGAAPALPLPAEGSLAVDVLGPGGTRHAGGLAADTVRPIASVAKAMTALVVLEQRALRPGETGPVLTMSALDQSDYLTIRASGGSYAPVHTGEQLTERDLLLGLMLPSANNMALTLARWIDGSVVAFVARLNARAAALGMSHTHFADPDGLSAQTTSTASDLVLLGSTAVGSPAFVDIVSTPSATLPAGTVVGNLDELLLRKPDWIGIKTGWTPLAGGCLLFAARRTLAPGTAPVTVVGAVLAQPPEAASDPAHPELGAAMRSAAVAADAAFGGVVALRLSATHLPFTGTVHTGDGVVLTPIHAAGPDRWIVVTVGDTLTTTTSVRALSIPLPAHARVGTLTVSNAGRPVATWTLQADTPVTTLDALPTLLHR